MKFCSNCGHTVELKTPDDDNRPRYCCSECDTIHYQNPLPICGTINVREDGKILMCKRDIEPRKGKWTLPAGFLENGEGPGAGAIRETWEEAGCTTKLKQLFTVFGLPHINQVYMFFLAEPTAQPATKTFESSEICYMSQEEIPWDDLAFPVITRTLQWWFEHADQSANQAANQPDSTYPLLSEDIFWDHGTQTVRYESGLDPKDVILVPLKMDS